MLLATLPALGVVAVSGSALAVLLRRRSLERDRMARRDPLTGLGNRTRLAESAAAALKDVKPGEAGCALLLVDLDGFKDVNDTLGHAAGDDLLVQVANHLAQYAGEGAMATRLGGDEFAVLLTGPVTGDEAEVEAKRILARLDATTFTTREVSIDVRASIGVAVAPRDGTTLSELLQHADVAMYQAKRARAGVARYEAGSDHHSLDRLEMLARFRSAMDEGELVLHYQPKVRASDGSLLGFEALLRWEHPVLGPLGPADFIGLVERTSLIHPLTRWVVLGALKQASSWREQGMETTVSVNVSAVSLEPGLLYIVQEALARYRWPADRLVLEVTESAIMENAAVAREAVTSLRDLGVAVSVDDFGAGYTSLAQLRGLPVHELKIDKQFVEDLSADPDDDTIVAAVIELGHRLGLQVVAEGVETERAALRLAELGCDELQGFLISRPMPAGDVVEWAAQHQGQHRVRPLVRAALTGAPPG